MELSAIFLLLAVLILVGIYLYSPFITRSRRMADEAQEISALMAERDRVINSLQELDFDHKLGKIPDEDYPSQRAELLQKGAEILRKLDSLTLSPSPREALPEGAGRGAGDEGDIAARIENAAAAQRADASAQVAELTDDDLESLIASRRKTHKDKSAGFCPRCGKPVLVTDLFCPSCGKSLK